MPLYTLIPKPITATQFNKLGDHYAVSRVTYADGTEEYVIQETVHQCRQTLKIGDFIVDKQIDGTERNNVHSKDSFLKVYRLYVAPPKAEKVKKG